MGFLIFFLFINLTYSKYIYNHIIKTDFTSQTDLINIMSSKQYYEYYLEEVNAFDVTYNPVVWDKDLNIYQIIDYKSKPKISLFPMKFPTINIVQKWIKKNNHTFNGNIRCSFIDFDLNIEIKKNETVYIDIESVINSKVFILPNKVLTFALMDYESIFNKIIKKIK